MNGCDAAKSDATKTTTLTTRVQPTMSAKYNERSSFQRKLNMVARPHLCAAMATLAERAAASEASSNSSPLPPPPRIAVADFGCSEGANAVEQMLAAAASALEAFEKKTKTSSSSPPRPLSITVAHSDLTNNGWNAVAAAIAAAAAGSKTTSYRPPSVVALMQPSDSGFYERCFADEGLDLVHGAITFHWASRGFVKNKENPSSSSSSYDSLPSKLEDACIVPGLSSDAAVRALAAEASRGDWKRILAHRARELKQGGFLVSALICTKPGDDCCSLWHELAGCLRELVEEGAVTREEASAFVVPVHLRMPEDHRAALVEEKEFNGVFRIVVDEFEMVQGTERDAFLEGHRDPAKYGKDVANFYEAVSRTMLEAALAPRLGKEKATAVSDELYFNRFAGKVAEMQPEFSIGLQTLVLEKL